jgi:hypothetical protein
LQQFFADNKQQEEDVSGEKPIVRPPQTFVDFDITVLENPSQISSLLKTVQDVTCGSGLTFRIHFQSSPANWNELLDSFSEQQSGLIGSTCHLYGHFANMSEQDMTFLADKHFSLFFVPASIGISEQIRSDVHRLAEFGFRVPFVWYADADNITVIPDIIDDAMSVNINAGFAVPLAQESFFCRDHRSPQRKEYINLLTTLYKRYPCYDDVFYPFNHIFLESTAGERKNTLKTFYWDSTDFNLVKRLPDAMVEQTRQFLFRLFLWQRWVVFRTYTDTAQVKTNTEGMRC